MKHFILVTLLACTFVAGVEAGEPVPQKVIDLANGALLQIGKDPVIVAAVSAENSRKKTLDKIKADDEIWKKTPGITEPMKKMLESDVAKHLLAIQRDKPYIAEIFAMDNQGANVALTNKTSDYWQGDEKKFQNSFMNGQGAVFIDEVEFDESTQSYLVQVSVPVIENSKAIGAITFGIELDKLGQ